VSTPKQEPDRATPANLEMRPIPVHTGAADEEGRLVVANGRLVAVLVRLADQVHTSLVGCWFLEAGFGPCAGATPVFDSLEGAQNWIADRLGRGSRDPE
jgi:hypothetical protein